MSNKFISNAIKHKYLFVYSSAGHNMDWTSYHPVADMQEYMAYLVETYSDLVSIVSIGKSYEGNDMQVGKAFDLNYVKKFKYICHWCCTYALQYMYSAQGGSNTVRIV